MEIIRATIKKQKGQGIVEYALLLAFIVGIAMMLNGAGIKDSVADVFDSVASLLSGEKTYAQYFNDWHGYKSYKKLQQDVKNEDRIKADQSALTKIAAAFLGKEPGEVLTLMQDFSSLYGTGNSPDWLKNNFSQYGPQDGSITDGWSGVLVPLSYKDVSLDNNGYIWVESNNNLNTIQYLADDNATVYKRSGTGTNNVPVTNANGTTSQVNITQDSGGKSITTDRIFYSDDMIAQGNNPATNRTVTMQLHYKDGKVDEVRIAARKGKGENGTNSTAASKLDLTVKGSSSNPKVTVNN